MDPREAAEGINTFIEQEEVDAVDLNIVSVILVGFAANDTLAEDEVVSHYWKMNMEVNRTCHIRNHEGSMSLIIAILYSAL